MVPQVVRTPKPKKRRLDFDDNLDSKPSTSNTPTQSGPMLKKVCAEKDSDTVSSDDLSLDFPGFALSPVSVQQVRMEMNDMMAANELGLNAFDDIFNDDQQMSDVSESNNIMLEIYFISFRRSFVYFEFFS